MPAIHVILYGDHAWPDLAERHENGEVVHLPETTWQLAALEGGMSSGAPSLALRLDIPPDPHPERRNVVITETSLAAWIAATCALRGRFPESFAGTPLEG
jgi:hypothetical protein